MSGNVDHKVLRLILAAIASDGLQPSDYRIALAGIRDGEAIKVIVSVLEALGGSDRQVSTSERPQGGSVAQKKLVSLQERNPDTLFNDIKRRKITKDRLEEIIQSVNSAFPLSMHKDLTMRELVRAFFLSSSDRQWKILTSIINGQYESDPYFSKTWSE